jgi:putative ABC transport system substrate-binding protein
MQLLKEAVPQITRLGILNTRNARERFIAECARTNCERPENKLKLSIVGPPLEQPSDEQEYHRVFAALAQEGADGLLVVDEPENFTYRTLIVELAAKGHLPTIYPFRQFAEAGGLMAYGVDVSDLGHRIADLADKILKGAKPGEIPIDLQVAICRIIYLYLARARRNVRHDVLRVRIPLLLMQIIAFSPQNPTSQSVSSPKLSFLSRFWVARVIASALDAVTTKVTTRCRPRGPD